MRSTNSATADHSRRLPDEQTHLTMRTMPPPCESGTAYVGPQRLLNVVRPSFVRAYSCRYMPICTSKLTGGCVALLIAGLRGW